MSSTAPSTDEVARTLALLHREAQRQGLLDAADEPYDDGAVSPAAAAAIEALVDRLPPPAEPDEASCRRHHAAHAALFARGERVRLRHILFAVTPGVPVDALRQRAEQCLISLRARSRDVVAESARFAEAARQWSNCPSAAQGGELGWLQAADCAPEFAREVFGHDEVGVLARLVLSRFGLHVVEVLQREPGEPQPYPAVADAVRLQLLQQAHANQVQAYVRELADAQP